MVNRFNGKTPNRRFAKADYSIDSIKVQSGLTLTPAQMYGMMLQGKPISSFQIPEEHFDDGVIDEAENIVLPMEEQRSIDVNDLWQFQKDLEQKSINYRTYRKQKNNGKTEKIE